jgi:agmatine deiminase
MNFVVYLASALSRYPSTMGQMMNAMGRHGIRVEILNTTNVWLRDWMPQQVGDHFVKFTYKDSTYDEFPQLIVPENVWRDALKGREIIKSKIVLDGGNIVRNPSSTQCLITDIIFKHNPNIAKAKLISDIERLLNMEVVLMPVEPWDTILGHTDGVVHFIDDKTVLLNDYRSATKNKSWNNYQTKASMVLLAAGLSCIPMPWSYMDRPKLTEAQFRKRCPFGDSYLSGWGYLINFLQVGNLILLPKMGQGNERADIQSAAVVRECFPKSEVVQIPCAELSLEGGLCACVSMNYLV